MRHAGRLTWTLTALFVLLTCLVAAAGASADGAVEGSDMVAAVAQLTAISHPLASMPALRSPVTLSSSLSAGGPDGLGFADLFDKTLATRAAGAQSLAQLATQLTTSTPVDAGGGRTASITAAASFGSGTDTLTIDMSATRQVHGASFSFNSSTPNLTLSGPAAADATLQFATHFVIHYDTTSQDAWLDASGGSPPLTITSTLGPANGATAGVGVLAVTIGSASLAVHQHLLATLGAPDAGGHIDLASGGYASIAPTGMTAGPDTGQHDTLSGSVALTPALGTGMTGVPTQGGTVTATDNDLSDQTPPTVTTNGLDAIAPFTNLSPQDLANGIAQYAAFADAAERTTLAGQAGAKLGDIDLPLMHGKLSDTYEARAALDAFLQHHDPPATPGDPTTGVPDFGSIQQMAAELGTTSDGGATVTVDGLSFDQQTNVVSFGLHVHGSRSDIVLDPNANAGNSQHVGLVDFGDAIKSASGMTGAAAGSAAVGSPTFQLDLHPQIDLSPPGSSTKQLDRFKLQTGSTFLTADVPIHTNVDLLGSAGALSVHAGGSLAVTPPGSGHMLSMALVSGGDRKVGDLVRQLGSSPSAVVSANNGGALSAALGLDVPGETGFFTGGCSNENKPSCTDATIDWSNIGNPATLSVSGNGLDTIKAFTAAGSPSGLLTKVSAGLNELSLAIGKLPVLAGGTASTALNSELPLASTSLAQLFDTGPLNQAIQSLQSQAPASVADVAQILNNAVGNGSSVRFSVLTANNKTYLLTHLAQDVPIDKHVPLAFSTGATSLTEASATGSVHLQGDVNFDLTMAIAVDTGAGAVHPYDVLVMPDSKISAQVTVGGSAVIGGRLGPYAVSLGAPNGMPSDPSVLHAAVDVAVSDSSPGTDPVSFGSWAQALSPQLNQQSQPVTCSADETGYGLDFCAHLPVYLSSDGGQSYAKVTDTGNNDLILRLPATDATFNPADPPIPGPSGSPDLPRTELPDGLTDALANALISFDSLRYGVDQFLTTVQTGLDAASNGGRLPFVGSDLQEGKNFVGDVQSALDAALAGLPAGTDVNAGGMSTAIQQAISNALDTRLQGPVDVQLDCASGPCDPSDPATSIRAAHVSFDAGSGSDIAHCEDQNNGCAGFGIPIDLGIPGLSLKADDPSNDKLSGGIGWHLHVAVGLDSNGFFVSPGNGLTVGIGLSAPPALTADLSLLKVNLTDLNNGNVPVFSGTVGINLKNQGDVYLSDLVKNGGQDLVDATMSAQANADWHVQATADSDLPGVSADFHLLWSWSSDKPSGTVPSELRFDNVGVIPGKILSGVLGPVASQLNQALGPFQPFISDLTAPLPVLTDLSHLAGGADVSVSSLLGLGSSLSGDENMKLANRIVKITTIVNKISIAAGTNQPIPIGALNVNPDEAMAGASPESLLGHITPDPSQDWQNDGVTNAVMNAMFPGDQEMLDLLKNQDQGGFKFPILDEPSKLLGLLVGQDVDIVRYDAGKLSADINGGKLSFPLDEILPLTMGGYGELHLRAHLAAGFDTFGIREAVSNGAPADLLKGFYIDTRDSDGAVTPNLALTGRVGLYAKADGVIASVEADGGLALKASLGLHDSNGDGKFRPAQGMPCTFDGQFASNAYVTITAELGHDPFSKYWTFDLVNQPLFDYSSSCPPGGGREASYGSASSSSPWLYAPQPPNPIADAVPINIGMGPNSQCCGVVQALNQRGDVIGSFADRDTGENGHGFIWLGGKNHDLGATGFPVAINDAGEVVVGHYQFGTYYTFDRREPDGYTTPVLPFPGSYTNFTIVDPKAGDCAGDIYYRNYDHTLWMVHDGTHTEVPTPNWPTSMDGHAVSVSPSIPTDGPILSLAGGYGPQNSATRNHAVELQGDHWVDLNTLFAHPGWTITDASANSRGDIMASGYNDDGVHYMSIFKPDGREIRVVYPTDPTGFEANVGPFNSEDDVLGGLGNTFAVLHDGHVYNLATATGTDFTHVWGMNDRAQVFAGLADGHDTPVMIQLPWGDKSELPPPKPCQQPSLVKGLVAAPQQDGSVTLDWTNPDRAPGLFGFNIYRYTTPGTLDKIGFTTASTTTFTDHSAPPFGVRYAVSAQGADGEGTLQLAAPRSGSVHASIDASTSADVNLPDGLGQLSLPAGLVSSPTTFTVVEPASGGGDPGQFELAGQTFSISAADSDGDGVTSFPGSYTLTVNYDPSKLPPGADETDVNLRYWSNGQWVGLLPCAGCSLNTTNHTITVVLNHLTNFAIMVPAPPPGPGPTPTPSGSGSGSGGDQGTPPASQAPQPTAQVGTTAGTGLGSLPTPTKALKLAKLNLTALKKKHVVGVVLANPNAFAINGSTVVNATYKVGKKTKSVKLATAKVSVAAAQTKLVKLTLAKTGLKALLAGKAQKFTLVLTDSASGHTPAIAKLKLKLPLAKLR